MASMSVDVAGAVYQGPADLDDEIDFEPHEDADSPAHQDTALAVKDSLDEITFDESDGLLGEFANPTQGQNGASNNRSAGEPTDTHGDFEITSAGLVPVGEAVVASALVGIGEDESAVSSAARELNIEGSARVEEPGDLELSEQDQDAGEIGYDDDEDNDELIDQDDVNDDLGGNYRSAPTGLGRGDEEHGDEEEPPISDQGDTETGVAWLLNDSSAHGRLVEEGESLSLQPQGLVASGYVDEGSNITGAAVVPESEENRGLSAQPGRRSEPKKEEMLSGEHVDASAADHEAESGSRDNWEGNGEDFVDDTYVSPADSYDHDYPDRPDVRVFYRGSEYSLFSKSASDDPDAYFFSDGDALDYNMLQVLDGLREIVSQEVARDEELLIHFDGLGLEFSEGMDAEFLETTEFKRVIQLHHDLVLNDGSDNFAVALYLTTRPHSARRFAMLCAAAERGEGLTSLRTPVPRHLLGQETSFHEDGTRISSHFDEDEEVVTEDADDAFDREGEEGGEERFDPESPRVGEDPFTDVEAAHIPGGGEDSLLDSYDQAVDEDARDDGSIHSGISGHRSQGVADSTAQSLTGDVAAGDSIEILEEEEREEVEDLDHQPRFSGLLQTIERAQVDGEGESNNGVELWNGDSGAGAGPIDLVLDLELEHPSALEAQASDQGQEDPAFAGGDHSGATEVATNAEVVRLEAGDLEAWDGDDRNEEADLAVDDRHANVSDEHDGHEDTENASHSRPDAAHLEVDTSEDFDFTALATAGSSTAQPPMPSAHEIISEQTSASATLNGDEIDFEDGGAETGQGAGSGGSAEHGASHDPRSDGDEIDWDDNDNIIAGPEAGTSTPTSVTGKRVREMDDSEESGEGHDVKRHRA